MGTFFISVVGIIIAIVAFTTYRRLQQTKAQAAKLVSLNNSVRQIQERYKDTVSSLASDNIIDGDTRRKLITIVNNYFVFQPVNAVNLAHLMDLVDVFINAIEGHSEEPKISDERFTEILITLANAIPESTRDFSSSYYLNYAPGLFFEFSNQVKDDIHEPNAEENEADKEKGEEQGENELAAEPEQSESDDNQTN